MSVSYDFEYYVAGRLSTADQFRELHKAVGEASLVVILAQYLDVVADHLGEGSVKDRCINGWRKQKTYAAELTLPS